MTNTYDLQQTISNEFLRIRLITRMKRVQFFSMC